MNSQGGSDKFTLMTRTAAAAYGGIFPRVWINTDCAGLPWKKGVCRYAKVPDVSTECLIHRQFQASKVTVILDSPRVDMKIIRLCGKHYSDGAIVWKGGESCEKNARKDPVPRFR